MSIPSNSHGMIKVLLNEVNLLIEKMPRSSDITTIKITQLAENFLSYSRTLPQMDISKVRDNLDGLMNLLQKNDSNGYPMNSLIIEKIYRIKQCCEQVLQNKSNWDERGFDYLIEKLYQGQNEAIFEFSLLLKSNEPKVWEVLDQILKCKVLLFSNIIGILEKNENLILIQNDLIQRYQNDPDFIKFLTSNLKGNFYHSLFSTNALLTSVFQNGSQEAIDWLCNYLQKGMNEKNIPIFMFVLNLLSLDKILDTHKDKLAILSDHLSRSIDRKILEDENITYIFPSLLSKKSPFLIAAFSNLLERFTALSIKILLKAFEQNKENESLKELLLSISDSDELYTFCKDSLYKMSLIDFLIEGKNAQKFFDTFKHNFESGIDKLGKLDIAREISYDNFIRDWILNFKNNPKINPSIQQILFKKINELSEFPLYFLIEQMKLDPLDPNRFPIVELAGNIPSNKEVFRLINRFFANRITKSASYFSYSSVEEKFFCEPFLDQVNFLTYFLLLFPEVSKLSELQIKTALKNLSDKPHFQNFLELAITNYEFDNARLINLFRVLGYQPLSAPSCLLRRFVQKNNPKAIQILYEVYKSSPSLTQDQIFEFMISGLKEFKTCSKCFFYLLSLDKQIPSHFRRYILEIVSLINDHQELHFYGLALLKLSTFDFLKENLEKVFVDKFPVDLLGEYQVSDTRDLFEITLAEKRAIRKHQLLQMQQKNELKSTLALPEKRQTNTLFMLNIAEQSFQVVNPLAKVLREIGFDLRLLPKLSEKIKSEEIEGVSVDEFRLPNNATHWLRDAFQLITPNHISFPHQGDYPAEFFDTLVENFNQDRMDRLKTEAPNSFKPGIFNIVDASPNSFLKYFSQKLPCDQSLKLNSTYFEGGNALKGEHEKGPFVLIGKDSLFITKKVLNHELRKLCSDKPSAISFSELTDEELKPFFAQDFNVAASNVHYIEQPGAFHLDMGLLCLGNTVIVNSSKESLNLWRQYAQTTNDEERYKNISEAEYERRLREKEKLAEKLATFEDQCQLDLENVGFKVVRFGGVLEDLFQKEPEKNRTNFFNSLVLKASSSEEVIISMGSLPFFEKAFSEMMKTYFKGSIYYLPKECSKSLEKDGGIHCLTQECPWWLTQGF